VRFLAAARWVGIAQFAIGAGLLIAAIILAPRYFGEGAGCRACGGWGRRGAALAALVLAIFRKSLPAMLLGWARLWCRACATAAGRSEPGPVLDQRAAQTTGAGCRPPRRCAAGAAGYQEPV